MKLDINYSERFETRHNGLEDKEMKEMLKIVGVNDIEQLIDETIPADIRLKDSLNLPVAKSEGQFLDDLRASIAENQLFDTFIGMG